ncbi:hypothetical protein CA13_70380 [Planctomycetes bacterium CA13]|uniref:Uncharacterized protein n=1 Tax=Novipirellula herctigrandis TaxID=2527986 RepID=A0A5C5YNT0_9BACT|nr:hypothetical protein CA13_70380 [Planctomycetes bacterium CA13]
MHLVVFSLALYILVFTLATVPAKRSAGRIDGLSFEVVFIFGDSPSSAVQVTDAPSAKCRIESA